MHQAIPTNDFRDRQHLAASATCPRCNSQVETVIHCLRDCSELRGVWSPFSNILPANFYSILDCSRWLKSLACSPISQRFLACIWNIWLWRNNCIFGDTGWSLFEVLQKINATADDLHCNFPSKETSKRQQRADLRWLPPNAQSFKLNVDGSANLNNLTIGSGGLLRNHDGNWIAGFSSFDGSGNALKAELLGLYHGLSLIQDMGLLSVSIETDCLEMVSLIKDHSHHAQHPFADILQLITNIMSSNRLFSLHHVLREQNACADHLAKLGSSGTGFNRWDNPPESLVQLLLIDSAVL